MPRSDGVDETFEAERTKLFSLAYRMLGSASIAEEIVQDAYLRWSNSDRSGIEIPEAWLIKVVSNLCLNHMSAAPVRREHSVGLSLPEPVITEYGTLGPLDSAVQREAVSIALLSLLQTLTPTERAVFVLRESFSYEHSEVAEVLGISESNSRQLHRRARHRVAEGRSRFEPDPTQWRALVETFLDAARSGEISRLEKTLATDVTYRGGDTDGALPVARRPVTGRARVARFFVKVFTHRAAPGVQTQTVEVNAEPALLASVKGRLIAILVFEVNDEGEIVTIRTLANRDKLTFADRQAAWLSASVRV